MTLVRLLAVLCLVASSSSVLAQRVDVDHPVNFGRQWQSWSDETRSVYLSGYVEGGSDTYFKAWSRPELTAAAKEQLRLDTATLYENDLLRDVITDLYHDPANALVRFGAMVYIARDKLSGKNIDAALRSAREKERSYPSLK